jgi:hypothetical protein
MSRRAPRATDREGPAGRGQANLVAVVAALLALTAAAALGLALVDGAFAAAERPVEDRRVATALSERLVAPDSPLTDRANVLADAELVDVDAAELADEFPVVGDRPVRVRVGDRTVVERGDPTGVTVRRAVLVADRGSVGRSPRLTEADDGYATTLPRRSPEVTVTLSAPPATTVTTVRANGRVVLHDPDGLDGTYTVDLSRYETTRLTFAAEGPLPPNSVELTYYPATTTKAVLEVTVGD